MDEPFIAPTAHRHGVSDEIILHVFINPIRTEELDDDLVMVIGPDLAGTSTRSVSSPPSRAPSSSTP